MSETALSREPDSGIENTMAAVRERMRFRQGEATAVLRVVYAGAAAYAVLFALAAAVHYAVFAEPRFDLGDMAQAIWNTQHGRFLETTTLNGHQHDRLGFHVDPFLLLFVPLFRIGSSPVFLLVVQAMAVASGALPVFWLARKHLDSSRASAHFAFAYLLYPATQFNAFTNEDGFHPVSFAVPLVLFALWFLDEDRLVAFSVIALLAFTTKEEIPLAVGSLGLWYAVRRKHRLFGLSVFGVGLAVTLFNFLWVIPHLSPNGVNPFAGRYRAVGGTPEGIAHKLVTDPLAVSHAVATGHKAFYLILLLVPFLGLWLFEPFLLLGAVPDLAINLLSSERAQTDVIHQYTAGIVPFIVAASIFGAARFKQKKVQLSMAVLLLVASTAILSPVFIFASDLQALGSPRVSAKAHALRLIPPRVPVSASNQLGGHLSERRYIYQFPYAVRANWIIADVNDATYPDIGDVRRSVKKYKAEGAWRVVFSSHGVVVLHRRSPGQ